MNRTLTLLLFLLALALPSAAQDDPEYRMEIGAGVGLDGYLGDFNSSLTSDLQPMASLLARYVFNPYMGLKLNASYGKLKGNSADVETYYPDYAQTRYAFSNAMADVCLTYEYNFWPYGTGRDYRGAKRLTPFVFGGMGLTYADADKSRFAFNVPVGLGIKYKVGERMNLGLEWAIHFTQSDWLDGVKDPYYVESSGLFKNTDCYSALQFTVTYSFAPKCVTCNKE